MKVKKVKDPLTVSRERVMFYLEADLVKKLKEICEQKDVPMCWLVPRLIRQALKDRELH